MGNILRPNGKLQLPNGLAERREQERIDKLIPLAVEEQNKAMKDFQEFLDTHNVTFQVHLDYRQTERGKRTIGQGLTFISKLLLPPEEEERVQQWN